MVIAEDVATESTPIKGSSSSTERSLLLDLFQPPLERRSTLLQDNLARPTTMVQTDDDDDESMALFKKNYFRARMADSVENMDDARQAFASAKAASSSSSFFAQSTSWWQRFLQQQLQPTTFAGAFMFLVRSHFSRRILAF